MGTKAPNREHSSESRGRLQHHRGARGGYIDIVTLECWPRVFDEVVREELLGRCIHTMLVDDGHEMRRTVFFVVRLDRGE